MRIVTALGAAIPLLLVACGPSQPAADAPANAAAVPPATHASTPASDAPVPGTHRFASTAWGFRIDYPAAMRAGADFSRSYLDNGEWKTYAGPGSVGTPVLDLVLPASDTITAGELRVGVSDDAGEIARCTTPSDAVRAGSVGHARLGDADFTTFEASDAAMSHYLSVRSYRIVHAGRCYAIDLLVTGTNPQVYDPPATPPFSQDQAFAQLQQALQTFRFTP
jgi:hypothetical protein